MFVVRKAVEKVKRKIESNIEKNNADMVSCRNFSLES